MTREDHDHRRVRGTTTGGHRIDSRVLERVRALLAKAESTSFPAEAEAFTAKAQELMARHAIDEVLLDADAGGTDAPSTRVLVLEDPYADAKMSVLSAVAGANRCRVVYEPATRRATVFGYAHDLDAVEVLGTSLLTQATTAMLRHGSHRDVHGRSRTRSFRRAFLLGFAQRVGERLREATEAQLAATDDAEGRLVPVLAARDERVRAAMEEAFPDLVGRRTTASNPVGWDAGRVAGQLARLGTPRRPLT